MQTIGFPILTIGLFVLMVGGALWADIRTHRRSTEISLSGAARWSVFYVGLAGAFALFLWAAHGGAAASLFLTGYVLEKVLSVDNLMIFAVVFLALGVRSSGDQHRALHWGIAGAILFRLVFVSVGIGSLWLFGRLAEAGFAVVVAWSAVKILRGAEEADDLDKKWYMVQLHRVFGNSARLVLCIAALEITDVMFAFDSVPAVIAATRDPVLVYTAMIFAILGLRSLYFVLAALRRYLAHLDKAVAAVLFFIAGKLALSAVLDVQFPAVASLVVVLITLAVGVVASVRRSQPEPMVGEKVVP
jgi:tellurite resistance protein TerC